MNNITYYDNALHSEEYARITKELGNIAKELEKMKLQQKIIEKINHGMLLDEIMDYIFSSFQILIPYERIGVAFLEGSSVKSKWVKSKTIKNTTGTGLSGRVKRKHSREYYKYREITYYKQFKRLSPEQSFFCINKTYSRRRHVIKSYLSFNC